MSPADPPRQLVPGFEIERKFLVAEMPGDAALGRPQRLRQGYLVGVESEEVRIRAADDEQFTLTYKRGRGNVRVEREIALTRAQFDELWPATEGRRIEKLRYAVAIGGATAYLDVYEGELAGLRTVEVEFRSEAAQRSFSPPPWFGPDVTDDVAYTNRALAMQGPPRA